MREILKVIQFIWPVLRIPLIVASIIIVPLSLFGFVMGLCGYDEIAHKVGKMANWWWHENGMWLIAVIATTLVFCIATIKTFIEPSPLNWEIRQMMADKNSKLNKTASYFLAYIKGARIEKKEDIVLNVKPMKSVRPSGPSWFIKFWILFWFTFLFTFKAWSDEVWNIWKEWRKRHKENKEARNRNEEEPHKNAGFLNYFFPAFVADIVNNIIGKKGA